MFCSSFCPRTTRLYSNGKHDLTLAIAAHDANVVRVRERREAARHAERLENVHVSPDREVARFVDLADDVNALAADLENRHRDDRVGDELLEAFRDLVANLEHGLSGRLYLADQRIRNAPVGPHQRFLLQRILAPY